MEPFATLRDLFIPPFFDNAASLDHGKNEPVRKGFTSSAAKKWGQLGRSRLESVVNVLEQARGAFSAPSAAFPPPGPEFFIYERQLKEGKIQGHSRLRAHPSSICVLFSITAIERARPLCSSSHARSRKKDRGEGEKEKKAARRLFTHFRNWPLFSGTGFRKALGTRMEEGALWVKTAFRGEKRPDVYVRGEGNRKCGLGREREEGQASPHTPEFKREIEREKETRFVPVSLAAGKRKTRGRESRVYTHERKKGKGTRRRRRKRPKASALIVSLEASLLRAEKRGKDAGGRKRRPRVRKEGGKATAAREMLFSPTLFLSSPSAATATRVFEGSRKETKRKRREEGSLSLSRSLGKQELGSTETG